jgi:hypothetical protein
MGTHLLVVDCRRRIVEAELLFSVDGHGSLTKDILILRQTELLRQQRHFKTEHGPIALWLQFQPSCPLRVTGYISLSIIFVLGIPSLKTYPRIMLVMGPGAA